MRVCMFHRVHIKIAEHITVVAGRDGGLQTMEVLGMATLRVGDPECAHIQIAIDHKDDRAPQFQVLPTTQTHNYSLIN